MSTHDEVRYFLEYMYPYRKVHARRNATSGLWPTIPLRLSDELIAKGLRGEVDIGYFCEPMIGYFVLDIDDHHSLGCWDGDAPSLLLESRWKFILDDIGIPPGMIVRTPHGVHAYCWIDRKVPSELLEQAVGERLTVAKAEFRPKVDEPVRLPVLTRRLNLDLTPNTNALQPPDRVPIEALFGSRLDPDEIRRRSRDERKSGAARTSPRRSSKRTIERAEKTYGEFQNGASNDDFRSLMAVYYSYGVSEEEALMRLTTLVNRSMVSGYRGGLIRPKERARRAKGSYAGLERLGISPTEHASERLDAGWVGFARHVAEAGGWPRKARPGVEKFVRELITWVQFLDKVYAHPGRRVAWNYINGSFIRMMRDGYYPLPSGMLQRWKHDYKEVLVVLISIGVIQESPGNYSAGRYCRHYRVNPYRLLKSESAITMTGSLTIECPA